jgi:hypothetical protein
MLFENAIVMPQRPPYGLHIQHRRSDSGRRDATSPKVVFVLLVDAIGADA